MEDNVDAGIDMEVAILEGSGEGKNERDIVVLHGGVARWGDRGGTDGRE